MSVWFAIPSKRPVEEAEPVLKLWRERGYRVALQRDLGDVGNMRESQADGFIIEQSVYKGYAVAVNTLVKLILETDPQAEWIVTGGDDVEPDPNHSAETIAAQCSEMFAQLHAERYKCSPTCPQNHHTMGVMQPTGDRWGEHDIIPGKTGAYIDRVCGSPWMGREFCRRMYQGQGPLFSGYYHMRNCSAWRKSWGYCGRGATSHNTIDTGAAAGTPQRCLNFCAK